MTARDGNGSRRLRIEHYVLDFDRGCLTLDGTDLALRPKTFSVLQFLVVHAGRLVSKDELIAAVWPDVTVTDDTLVQSIGELRRAFGDGGTRFIKTIPRRGYRFEASVVPEPAPTPEPTTSTSVRNLIISDATETPNPPAALIASPIIFPTQGDRTATSRAHTWSFGFHEHVLKWAASARTILHPLDASRALIFALAIGALVGAWVLLGQGPGKKAVAPPVSRPAGTMASALEAKPAIAILPFVNNTGEKEREHFADGMTQDIINALGRFSGLTVMSWNAVAPLKGKSTHPAVVAQSLRVRYQVEGTIQFAAQRVRVTAQVVNNDGRVLWSGRFDEAFVDLFALQDKLTAQLAGALAIRVTHAEQERALAKRTENLEAYDLVLRARPALQRPNREGIIEARALLRRAIALDPAYAAALVALGETYHVDVAWGWAQSPVTTLGRAEELATAALRIDGTQLSAHILRGRIHLFFNRYEQAATEMDRALAINPSDSNGLAGRGNILMWVGHMEQAIEALERAQWIDPELNAVDRFSLSLAYYLKRRYEAAIVQAERNLRYSESARFSYIVLAMAYAQQGRLDEVARVVAAIRSRQPTFDPKTFGTKLQNPIDLLHVRDGLRKAGFDTGVDTAQPRKN